MVCIVNCGDLEQLVLKEKIAENIQTPLTKPEISGLANLTNDHAHYKNWILGIKEGSCQQHTLVVESSRR